MSFEKIRQIPSSEEIIDLIPIDNRLKGKKLVRDSEIKNIFTGTSDKFLLIIGPCSADDEDAVCEYVTKIAAVQEKVKDKILIIPRIYTNKPRTNGEGYKGMLHQPDPHKVSNMLNGIKAIRNMHIRAIKESGLFSADEMLYPENYPYLSDLLSYVAVGARSVENQQHRLAVSGIDIPVGMKNPTGGDLSVMLNSIHAAQMSNTFMYTGFEVKTSGNPFSHAVLRGSVDDARRNHPNYHFEDLNTLAEDYLQAGLLNPSIIIDTNHANSMKRYFEQPRIVTEVLRSRQYSDILKSMIKGLMIESYLKEGNQKPSETEYGKSITDGCLGWDATEALIYKICELL